MQTVNTYQAGNRSFPSFNEAFNYCLTVDFDPSIIQMLPYDINLIGKPFEHNDFKGNIIKYVDSGSFKGCYEVKVNNVKTGETCHWWFKKHIIEERYNKTA